MPAIAPGLCPVDHFGPYAQRVCRQWARNPALGCRMIGVLEALRRQDANTMLEHLWSEDMAAVLGEIAWAADQT